MNIIKKILNLKIFLKTILKLKNSKYLKHLNDLHEMYLNINTSKKNIENLILLKYKDLINKDDQKIIFKINEFKLYSQNGEDGILLYIFSKIGFKNKFAVNIGCGGITSNIYNLTINFGFKSFEIDGNASSIEFCKSFIKQYIIDYFNYVRFVHSWIDRDNINKLLKDNNVPGEVDLLSIDIDGNDYWIWEAIDIINPRVIVIEYNASFGYEKLISVKYEPDFDRWKKHKSGWYHGASLRAFEFLGKKRGYSLICCDSNGVNAFFIRNDLINTHFRKLNSKEAYYPHFQRIDKMSVEEQYKLIENMEYVEIE